MSMLRSTDRNAWATKAFDAVRLSRSESAAKLSSFGSFVVRSKGPRTGRNPKTGIEVSIAPRQVVVFKASDTLRKRLATVEETTE
jgi:nucleoid DNA-binding protein